MASIAKRGLYGYASELTSSFLNCFLLFCQSLLHNIPMLLLLFALMEILLGTANQFGS